MRKKLISAILALAMVFALLPGLSVSASGAENPGTYTFDTYLSEAPTNWSPMYWGGGGNAVVRAHIETPLVEITVKDSEKGEYQWAFLAATSVKDITVAGATNTVYEIKLNPSLCWEDGTPINADTYIYSLQQILDPAMGYQQAAAFYQGVAALAGAEAYAFSGNVVYKDNGADYTIESETDLVPGQDGNYQTADGYPLYIALAMGIDWLGGMSLKEYVDSYGAEYFDMEAYAQLEAQMDENGLVPLNDGTMALIQQTISAGNWGETPDMFIYYLVYGVTYPVVDWSVVGLTKVDDYTLRYTCANLCGYFDFLMNISGISWLIHEELYESTKEAGTYGTSPETTMSYGPYKLQSADASGVVLVRNEKHFEYTADANGKLSSVTSFQVDGQNVSQWQMDTIVLQVLSAYEAEQQFLAGELDEWNMNTVSAATYVNSPALYQSASGTTYSIVMNADPDVLQEMDRSYGGSNSVVLSNVNFRTAFSLMMDRSGLDLGGYLRKGVLGLIDEAYYYDAENNPASVYRKSDAAMQAICDLYGVAYGAGTSHATLEAAYASIDGYDPEKAQGLMKQACDELVAAGLYTLGEPIVLTYAATTESEYTTKLTATIAEILNTAAQGSGFGTISVEPRISGWNWSNEVREGKTAMVLSGWSGNPLDPFGVMNLYLDPNYNYVPLNMDTTTETLTLNVGGKDYTMTWYEWGQVVSGNYPGSEYAGVLLNNPEALAKLEGAYLKQMYAIPAFSDASNSLLSYQVDYCTDEYSVLYGFGGTRLMKFNYTDAEWEAYVASGQLDYTGPIEEDFSACGDNLTWSLSEDGTLTISGTGDMYDFAAAADPAAAAVMSTGKAAPWHGVRSRITRIVIGEGVTSIGDNAFTGCAGVETVTIPAAVSQIGQNAFADCTGLTEIVFEGDAPQIEESAFDSVEAEITYPVDNETWTEEVMEDYGGDITWKPDGDVVVPTVKWSSISTSLGGNIAMNFYVELSEDLVSDPDAYIQFTFAGRTLKVALSEGKPSDKNGVTVYQFSCPITSKNMTDEITAQVYNASGVVGEPKSMSVDTYCNWVIANFKDEKTVNLMKGMLNYGASAQKLFNYRTDDLANATLAEEDKVFGAVDASAYKHSVTGTEEGIITKSMTLLLDSETTVRVYFELTGDKTIDEYTFTVDGVEVEPKFKDGKYYIERPNISAHRLDDMHVFTCGGITVTYGGLSYVNQVMTYYKSGTTFEMASALYAYSKAAEAYIG